MTLKMALRWKNPDASSDINLRYKDVFNKGFTSGAVITPSGVSLEATVSPFVLVNFDGAVVTSDANETLTVIDGQINYIVCRARYRLLDSAILSMQVLTEAAYLADPEIDWLHVVGVVDLSTGGPYAFVPANRVFTTQRHEVDKQGRSFWRDPVSTSGALPLTNNRDGDVRLALDTGTLYWWNDTAGSWGIFAEAPLQAHRDHEHVNGITGDSVATTLEPDISGTDMTIAAVPAGSSYTVNGVRLTAPVGTLTVSAASVGALRGLIQVAIDDTGAEVANYRVSKSADVLEINFARIVNISDNHPVGSYTLLFNSGAGTLSWAGGEPTVVVTGNTYRLYTSAATSWIDVQLVGAPPGAIFSDNYDVNASLKDDAHLLVGYWYWDGAATLSLGADKRTFGNLGWENLSDDAKNVDIHPRWEDLRGNMVYSGGTVTDLGGLNARISGPIVAYIRGRRYEVDGSYSGVVLSPSTTNYIYVDDTGALVIDTTAPSGDYADVAQVVTSGVGITTITDTRDPQIVVGNATRDSRVRFTGQASARWNNATTRLIVEEGGASTGVSVETGSFRTTDNLVEATTGALSFDDNNTSAPQALTAAGEADLTVLQPGNTTPSVFGTLRDLQRAKKFSVGVETGCSPSIGAGTSVNIAAGTFYDVLGRRVDLSGENVAISGPLADNVYAIVWDPDLTPSGSFKSVNLTAGSGCEIEDLPFAIAVLNGTGTAVTLLENTVRFADGQYGRDFVTVSGAAAFGEANFDTLRKAMLHIMCFAAAEPASKEIRVVGNLTEPNTVAEGACIRLTNATGFPWAQPSRFSGVKVVGKSNLNAAPGARPVVTWTSTTGPLIDFNATSSDVRGFGFQGVDFNASGAASVADRNRCLFKNVSRGFSCVDSTIDGNNLLSHFVYWTDSVVELGGGAGAASQSAGVLFQRVYGVQSVDNGGDALFFFGDNTGTGAAQVTDINGRLTLLDCVFECDVTDVADYLIWTDTEADTDTGDFYILIDRTTLSRMQRVFNNCDEAQKLITASTLSDISVGIANGTVSQAKITDTLFSGTSVVLIGADDVVGCSLASTCTLTISTTNRITSCDFSLGAVTGNLGAISNSTVNLGLTGILTAGSANSTSWPSINNSTILKANDNANSNVMLLLSSSSSRCVVTSTQFSYTNNGVTSTTPMVSMTGSAARLVMNGCTLNNPNGFRDFMDFPVVVTSTGDFRLSMSDCMLDMPLGFLQVNRASGTAGEVTIDNCVVATFGPNAIDIATGGTGYMASVSITGTKFSCAATDPVYNIFHAKELFVEDNVFTHINGAATYTFGGNTAVEGRQDVAIIRGNSFKGTTNGPKCDVYGDSYTKFVYEGNSQAVINVTSLSTTYLQISGQAFSRECTISGNQISCDSNSVSGSIASSLILSTGFAEASVTGNSVYCGASGANISAYMLLTVSRALTCTGNTVLSTQNVAGTVEDSSASITAVCSTAGDGNVTVSANTLESSVGGSGTGFSECFISVDGPFATAISGNVLRSRQSGTNATAYISADNSSYVTISDNMVRSSQSASLTTTSTCAQCTATGNLVHANAGPATVAIDASTVATATGNDVRGNTGTTALTAGSLSTVSQGAVVSGNNVASSGDVVCAARAVQSAICGHNSLIATSDAVAEASTTRTGGSSATVIGNSLRCGGTATLYCNNATGTSHLNAIKNNTSSAPTTEAVIGASAAIGAIQNNTSTGALSVLNFAAAQYTGGNNANI